MSAYGTKAPHCECRCLPDTTRLNENGRIIWLEADDQLEARIADGKTPRKLAAALRAELRHRKACRRRAKEDDDG